MSQSDKNSIKLQEENQQPQEDLQIDEEMLGSVGVIEGSQQMIRKRSHRKLDISNFIMKTYRILEDKKNSNIVEWTDQGNCFIVKDKQLFSKEVLPKYFKHSKFSSFVRQLNMYDFHKIRKQKQIPIFKHRFFQEGRMDLLPRIKRKSGEDGKQEDFASKEMLNFSEPFISFESRAHISTTNIRPIGPAPVVSTKSEIQLLRKENADLQQSVNELNQQISHLESSKQKKKQKLIKIMTTLMFFDLNSCAVSKEQSQNTTLRAIQEHFIREEEPLSFGEYRNRLGEIYTGLKARLIL